MGLKYYYYIYIQTPMQERSILGFKLASKNALEPVRFIKVSWLVTTPRLLGVFNKLNWLIFGESSVENYRVL